MMVEWRQQVTGCLEQQLWVHILNHKQKAEITLRVTWRFWNLKPSPSDTSLPTRLQHLILPKRFFPLRTKYSNARDYWETSLSNHHTHECSTLPNLAWWHSVTCFFLPSWSEKPVARTTLEFIGRTTIRRSSTTHWAATPSFSDSSRMDLLDRNIGQETPHLFQWLQSTWSSRTMFQC